MNSNTILTSKQGGLDLYLEVGDYSYPFEVILPDNLPSSFEHSVGKIRYSIKGTIDIPWAIDKHTVKRFTVVNNVDLNRFNPSLRQPMEVNDSKNILLSIGGKIYATLRVEKCGFVPGETVRFTAKINNTCNRNVIRTRVKLVQDLRFVGSSRELIAKMYKTRHEHRDVAKLIIDKEILGNTSEEIFSNQPLIVPSSCPTLKGVSKIIEVNYLLVFTFGVRGSIDKDLAIPITIGTVPLINNDQEYASSYFPTPSYEQSVFGSEKINEDEKSKGDVYESNETNYVPLYPNYIGFEQFK